MVKRERESFRKREFQKGKRGRGERKGKSMT